jgi:hypothetical protein
MSQVFLRMTSAAGLLTLALFFVGADPFLSAGAALTSLTGTTPLMSVNRALKGDRLPVTAPAVVKNMPDWRNEFGLVPVQQPEPQKPFACDPAFSPIFVSKTANVYRRCMA